MGSSLARPQVGRERRVASGRPTRRCLGLMLRRARRPVPPLSLWRHADEDSSSTTVLIAAVVASVVGSVLLCCCFALCFCWRRRKQREAEAQRAGKPPGGATSDANSLGVQPDTPTDLTSASPELDCAAGGLGADGSPLVCLLLVVMRARHHGREQKGSSACCCSRART